MVQASAPRMSRAEFRALLEEVRTWGRWGADDERGMLNELTPARTLAALRIPRRGETISLALPMVKEHTADTQRPVLHHMLGFGHEDEQEQGYLEDWFAIACHGSIHSHLDSLSHRIVDGRGYNGLTREQIAGSGRALRLSVDTVAHGIVTRGVLLDFPRLLGVEWLEPGAAILPEDLDMAERTAGLEVGAGDVLLVRTGRHARRAALGPWDLAATSAGLHATTARWLRARGIVALGGDGFSEVIPNGVEETVEPMHALTLVAIGIHLLDNLHLDDLAAACARERRWEFLFTAAPLRLPGGTGAPFNPIAVL